MPEGISPKLLRSIQRRARLFGIIEKLIQFGKGGL